MQASANQLVGGIDQIFQASSLSADRIDQSASVLAVDVVQALRSYAGAGPASGIGSIVA